MKTLRVLGMSAAPWRRGLLFCLLVSWLLGALYCPETARATPASWDRIVGVNLPQFKKEAAKWLSPEDAERLAALTHKAGEEPRISAESLKRPYTPVASYSFERDIVGVVKPYLERGKVDKVKGFFTAVNRARLLYGWAGYYPYRKPGYSGPCKVEYSIEVSDAKEYLILRSLQADVSPKDRNAKTGRTMRYPTGVYAP